jgi:hypothetical protein
MKNVESLYEPEEIRRYLGRTLATDHFRRAVDAPGGFIRAVVERAARYPLFVYECSEHPSKDAPDRDKTEWAHFYAWMGGIGVRRYANPAVHDAYYLHELYHKGFMSYVPGMTFEGWKDKMFRNELNASMASELELYFHHPQLREQTFDHEILADRFLHNPAFMRRWSEDSWGARDEVRLMRRELMLRENKDDPVEYWIHKFSQQNEAWAAIWSRRYEQVEKRMAELHRGIDAGMPRKHAMDEFMAWLRSPEITQGTEIPFPDEAEAFAGVYRLNYRHYQQSIAGGSLSARR